MSRQPAWQWRHQGAPAVAPSGAAGWNVPVALLMMTMDALNWAARPPWFAKSDWRMGLSPSMDDDSIPRGGGALAVPSLRDLMTLPLGTLHLPRAGFVNSHRGFNIYD